MTEKQIGVIGSTRNCTIFKLLYLERRKYIRKSQCTNCEWLCDADFRAKVDLVYTSLKMRTTNADMYRTIITDFFVPSYHCIVVNNVRFQQDNATLNTSHATNDLLSQTSDARLINWKDDVDWPLRRCNLTPLNYFLWVAVEKICYADKPETIEHLKANVIDAIKRHNLYIRKSALQPVL